MAFPQVQEAKKEHTRDDLRALYELPGNEDKRFELIDGEIYEVPSGTLLHSMIIKLLWKLLVNFTDDHKLGETFGDGTEYNLPNGNTVIPDISFVAAERMPTLTERFMYIAPDLAIEVVSPANTQDALRKKIKSYLESGTRRVWLVYPEDREILVYWQQDDGVTAYRTLDVSDMLSGEDVVPGFAVNVVDIFPQVPATQEQTANPAK